jgi:hypothetical protein
MNKARLVVRTIDALGNVEVSNTSAITTSECQQIRSEVLRDSCVNESYRVAKAEEYKTTLHRLNDNGDVISTRVLLIDQV